MKERIKFFNTPIVNYELFVGRPNRQRFGRFEGPPDNVRVQLHNYLPSSGTASEVAGIVSATMLRKTVSDSRIVTPGKTKKPESNCYLSSHPIHHSSSSLRPGQAGLPSESFSPESGGRIKPSNAIEAIRTQGTIKLKK